MVSLSAFLLKQFARRTIKRDGLSGEALVKHMRRSMNAAQPQLVPRGVQVNRFHHGALNGSYISTTKPSLTILYLHGGGFIAGRPQTYHNLAGRLAKALNAEVYIPDYPLAPEHPFPAGVEACFSLYRHLLEDLNVDPENFVVMGDSAGGGLTFATLLNAKQHQLPWPRCSVTLSPAVNIRSEDSSVDDNNATDVMLSADMIHNIPPIYADKSHWDNPLVSPILGDYTGCTPVFISSCSDECLYGSDKKMAHRLRQQKVKVRWVERAGLFHVWPIFLPWLKEAREDFHKIVDFIRHPNKL